MKGFIKNISCFLCIVTCFSLFPSKALAVTTHSLINMQFIEDWLSLSREEKYGEFGSSGRVGSFGGGRGGGFTSNQPQKYYTTPTSSEEDQQGNVINYFRGGDTTTTKIIDSYNHTFNNIWNTNNTTNNYSANIKLNDFLNSYTTNNNNYTYNTRYQSWYYDNTQNTLNYSDDDTYYAYDNRQYFVSIDNSTDEYYLIDVQYSPTFVTVNYNYYNTDNSTNYGDVTNIYYFELTDGRNSSTLTADEVGGLALGYDVTNYQLISDDPNTLSLQHFDGNYTDSSSYGRSFYSENRSVNYVDSGTFGKAVALSYGSAAGITIPGLWDNNEFQIEFRAYTSDYTNLSVFSGVQPLLSYKTLTGFFVEDYINGVSPTVEQCLDYFNHVRNCDAKYGVQLYNGFGHSDIYQGIKSGFSAFVDYDFSNSTVKDGIRYGAASSINISGFSSLLNASWHTYKIVVVGNTFFYFIDGELKSTISHDRLSTDSIYIYNQKSGTTLYLDELRVTTGDMVSTGSYTPSSEPFDTNKVLALPNELIANTIYVRHSTPVNGWRIGGVRPSNPATGFFYLPLHADYTGGQSQLYDGSNWVDVEAMVYDGSEIHSVIGYTFTPVSESPDVDSDLEPGRPPDPGEDVDQSTCTHTWEEASRTEPTCVLAGSVAYTCSKCGAKKTESIAKLGHTWEVKTSIPTTYDEEGNVVTQGYTIYKCSVCDEEYKDTDGTGPPVVESPDDSDGGGWFSELLKKIGEFFGTTIGALLELVGTIISKVLDSLITLVTNTVAKLTEVVTLFGSFSESMGTLWGWLPPEIVSVLVAGVTIIVFAAIIRLFFR